MTTEQNQPQAQPPQGQAPQGQPQGHRRRRRRRKGAKGQPNAPQANGQTSQQNQQPQGQKPKYSNQGRQYQKNGSGGGQGGGRRKNKQRRQQVFVGPMDHSYRVANGNIADGPPSTIEYRNGNGNPNGYHPTEVVETPPVPVREDAPTRIFCFIDDLFFLAKIQETARKLGVKVGFVKAEKDIVAKLSRCSGRREAFADCVRSEQRERQAADSDPKAQDEAEARDLDHWISLAPAG